MINGLRTSLFAILALLTIALMPSVFAGGYGTSKITLTQSSVSIKPGASLSIGYNVTIQSGNTWGTILHVVNQAQLSGQSINVTLSNPGGTETDPPFSGTMVVNIGASTPPGSYSVVLNATMDDPTTNNTVLSLNVPSSSTTTAPVVNGSTSASTTATSAPTSATTSAYSSGSYSSGSSGGLGLGSTTTWLLIIMAIVIIGAIAALLKKKEVLGKVMVLGVTLILLGILLWLYGDYSGGITTYIYGGIAALVVGIVIWLYADVKWQMFSKKGLPTVMIIIGVLLLVIGTGVWWYADNYAGGNLTYVWGGVIAMLIGVVIWVLSYRM